MKTFVVGTHWKHIIEMPPMSINNIIIIIVFSWRNKKITNKIRAGLFKRRPKLTHENICFGAHWKRPSKMISNNNRFFTVRKLTIRIGFPPPQMML